MTNVPVPTFGPNGFIIPADSEILAGVIADYQAAFGGNLNLSIDDLQSLDTPQGQLATSTAAIISEADQTFLFYTQQVDPAYATGRMQDAIGRIYFIERNPAKPTVVQALCTGLAGVVIPAGAQAVAEDGNIYICQEQGTISVSGNITLPFACQVLGPIQCPADTLNKIYQSINGWDSINNPTDGVIGSDTESRQEFEARRVASVAKNSVGMLNAILGSVLAIPNVLDAYVTENDTDSPITYRGQSLIANSLYVAVVGGDEDDVAKAIWSKKSPGCAYNGNTTVVVEDDNAGYAQPYPSYNVKFTIPDALPIIFAVDIVNNPQVPSNANHLIQQAIIAAFSGQDGGPRARIGSTIYASRFYGPVAALGSWVQIISIEIASANTPDASFTASISGTTLTVTIVGSGTLAVGQYVQDALGGVMPGTYISSFIGGSGGTGTYALNQDNGTVGSRDMKSMLPDQNSVEVDINQVPTINANNIAVTVT